MKLKKKNKFSSIFDLRYLFYDFVKLTGVFPAMLYTRVKKYHYLKKKQKKLFKGPVIVICNHIDYFDVIALLTTFWFRRISFVCKKELFEPFFGKIFFYGVQSISVNNKDIDIKTFKQAIDVLSRGHLLGIFPEGHVKTQEGLDKFKSGAVLLSYLTGVPIVSLYLQEQEKRHERRRVIIGRKFDVRNMIPNENASVEDFDKITKMIYDHENDLKEDLEKQLSKEY